MVDQTDAPASEATPAALDDIVAPAPKPKSAALSAAEAEAVAAVDAAATEQTPEGASIDLILNAWLYGTIAGGPIGRQTECWNALQNAIPALKAALLEGN